tara:strand:- start:1394 stop:1597 length:204 start_codon:yes stop_codon:yes gene_type:complete
LSEYLWDASFCELRFLWEVGPQNADMYPKYNVLAGAITGTGKTEYATRVSKIPTHFIPDFDYKFLKV